MNHPDDPIQIKHIDPASAGWMRVPDRPRTWEKPDGTIFTFPLGDNEVLVIPTENALRRFRRLAIMEFNKWANEQETERK